MFEDSTFESNGRIRTRSRGWMIASCAFNGLDPARAGIDPASSIRQGALGSRMTLGFLMEAAASPHNSTKAQVARVEHAHLGAAANARRRDLRAHYFFRPTPTLPTGLRRRRRTLMWRSWDEDDSGDRNNPFGNQGQQRPTVRQQVSGPVRVSGMVVEGQGWQKTLPVYPAIAKASFNTRDGGAAGNHLAEWGPLRNLPRCGSGSGDAAAGRAGRCEDMAPAYRPYLLSGDPVEVIFNDKRGFQAAGVIWFGWAQRVCGPFRSLATDLQEARILSTHLPENCSGRKDGAREFPPTTSWRGMWRLAHSPPHRREVFARHEKISIAVTFLLTASPPHIATAAGSQNGLLLPNGA